MGLVRGSSSALPMLQRLCSSVVRPVGVSSSLGLCWPAGVCGCNLSIIIIISNLPSTLCRKLIQSMISCSSFLCALAPRGEDCTSNKSCFLLAILSCSVERVRGWTEKTYYRFTNVSAMELPSSRYSVNKWWNIYSNLYGEKRNTWLSAKWSSRIGWEKYNSFAIEFNL